MRQMIKDEIADLCRLLKMIEHVTGAEVRTVDARSHEMCEGLARHAPVDESDKPNHQPLTPGRNRRLNSDSGDSGQCEARERPVGPSRHDRIDGLLRTDG